MLQIINLSKKYTGGNNSQLALKKINIEIKQGEFISILGPSGAGKTTLLKCINGLEKFDTGMIYLDKEKFDKDTIFEIQKKTGMIFQEFNLINNISVINNVLTGLLSSSSKFFSLFYLFTKEQKIKALKSLNTVGLIDKAYNLANDLSGGQRQRVGIARAIVKEPALILADEPVASLDPKSSETVMNLLRDVNKRFRTTVICNLHQSDLALKFSDRLIGLNDGQIIFDRFSKNINSNMLKKIYY